MAGKSIKLLELVCQGLLGTDKLEKFKFGQGYNLIDTSKIGITRGIFGAVYESSLFPAFIPSSSALGESAKGNGSLRIGLTFDHSGTAYRFVRDIAKGAFSLAKFNNDKNDFDEISKAEMFIERAFVDTFRMPEKGPYRRLFEISKDAAIEEYKSHKNRITDESRQYFSTLEEDAQLKMKIQRLKGLRSEKKRMDAIKSLEFEIDGLQQKLFECNDKVQRFNGRQEDVKAVEREIDEFSSLKCLTDFPKDIEQRLTSYEKLEERKNKELSALDLKLEDHLNNLAGLKIEPLQKDNLFILPVVLAATLFVLAIFFRQYLPYLLSALIVSLLAIGFKMIVFFKKREREEQINAEFKGVNDDKAMIEKKFEIETTVVRKLLMRLNVKGADDALEMIKREKELKIKLAEEKKSFEDFKKEIGYETALKTQEEIKRDVKVREERLKSIPPVSMDTNDLHREIEDLENELSQSGVSVSAVDGDDVARDQDPFSALLSEASRVLGTEQEKVVQAVKGSIATNLKILSSGCFEGAGFSGIKLESITLSGSGKPKKVSELDESEYLVAYFSCHFTLLSLLAKYSPVPLLVIGELDVKKPLLDRKAFLSAVSHLSRSMQVIHAV